VCARVPGPVQGFRSDEVRGEHFLGLDIGLPVEQLKAPLRACLAGHADLQELHLAARNRRGREMTCTVTVTPLQGGDEVASGVILLMEPEVAPVGAFG
jgi:two-component system, chemotaxis family, CheB/CheR fusion protein